MNVKIGKKFLGPDESCYITFEPSSTYTNFEEAKKMIEATAQSGADAVKFQTFLPGESDRIMGHKDIEVNFTTPTGNKQELVYDALKRKELSKTEWKNLVDFTHSLGIDFITSVYFPETVDFLVEIHVDAIKVSKGDVNNVLLIDKISKTGLPVILDAREKFDDVEIDINICEQNNNSQIIIMHCPSGYPAENSGVHLNAIKSICENYDYPVGFADHSLGSLMNFPAISLGASMLEVTITENKNIEHVEHFMSLELNELKNFVKNIRTVESALGNASILKKSRVEESARRSLVAKHDLNPGDILSIDNIDYRRPGNAGISVSQGFEAINKKVKIFIPKNSFIKWNMID